MSRIRILLPLFLLLLAHGFATSGAVVNVAGRGVVYSTYPLWAPGNWDNAMLVDGDRQTAIHLDAFLGPDADYLIDLAAEYSIQLIRLHPRQDGCCPERLSEIRVSVYEDAGDFPGNELWGVDLFTDGSNAGSGPGVFVDVPLPNAVNSRWVRIASLSEEPIDHSLQLADVEVLAEVPESEVNRALNTLVTSSEPLFENANPALLVDGNRGRQVLHGGAEVEPGFFYLVNLGVPVDLTRIVLWARQDGRVPERLTNFRVSVHPDNEGEPGPAAWSADRYTDGSNPGSWGGAKDELTGDLDPSGTFAGQWIRVEALSAEPYPLQMVEIEAFGVYQGDQSALLITSQPQDLSVGVGQTATFTVAARVVNGDDANIQFQWERNGVPIPGATNATYTTPEILVADDGAVFRCVVDHPELESQTSREAVLRVNLAFSARVTSNRPLYANWDVRTIVNGNRRDVLHGDVDIVPGFAYLLDLGTEVEFERIDIFPRQDGCCPERLQNFRVSVHEDAAGEPGEVVWSADLFTDGTNPGSFVGALVQIEPALEPSGAVAGRWVEILDLSDPVPNYSLQMAEIEIYGAYVNSEAVPEITDHPDDYGTVPGRRATFEIAARVINGDASLLSYQWTRNGEPIPGATLPAYQTPPLTAEDEGALFRCVVSYPGVPDVISEAATVEFTGNFAKGQPAYSNRPMWGALQISSLVNGIRTDFVHGDAEIAPGFAYEIDLGGDVDVERIDIYPRQDGCCGERLSNIRVQLLEDNAGQPGEEKWHADLFTDGSNPGSGAGLVVTITASDGTGDFSGGWLRILALDDPVGSYALQIAEVEVYGTGTVRAPLEVSIQRGAAGIEIIWTEGALEQTTDLGGTWEEVADATSPHVVQPTAGQTYFRVKRE